MIIRIIILIKQVVIIFIIILIMMTVTTCQILLGVKMSASWGPKVLPGNVMS